MKDDEIDKALKIWHHCGAKKVFKTEEEVKIKACSLRMYYYHCNICKNYHLTNKSKKSQRLEWKRIKLTATHISSNMIR